MVIGMLFDTVRNFDRHKFEIIIGVCLLFIFTYALYRKITGKKGSWTSVGNGRYIDAAKNILRTDAIMRMDMPTTQERTRGSGDGYGQHESSFPFIKESKGETECRRAIEKIYGKPFF